MSTLKGVNRTILDAATIDHTLRPGLSSGVVRVMTDTYEGSAAAVADVIEMGGEIPTGATILMVVLSWDNLGASITLDVGDLEDPNRYISAEDVSAAGSKIVALTDGIQYQVDMTTAATPDNQVTLLVGGSGTLSGTVKLQVYYTNE